MLEAAARCYAQIGETDEAIALLEACAERRCSNLVSLNVEPDFDDDPVGSRFQKLLRLDLAAVAAVPASREPASPRPPGNQHFTAREHRGN